MDARAYQKEFGSVLGQDGRARSVLTVQELQLSGNTDRNMVEMTPDTE